MKLNILSTAAVDLFDGGFAIRYETSFNKVDVFLTMRMAHKKKTTYPQGRSAEKLANTNQRKVLAFRCADHCTFSTGHMMKDFFDSKNL